MPELTVPLEEIEQQLSKIANYSELQKNPLWSRWLNSVFSWGMLGFDNKDAYQLVVGKTCRLAQIEADTLRELEVSIRQKIPANCSGLIIGAELPNEDLELAHQIMEAVISNVSEDCAVLMQSAHREGTAAKFMLFVLIVSEIKEDRDSIEDLNATDSGKRLRT